MSSGKFFRVVKRVTMLLPSCIHGATHLSKSIDFNSAKSELYANFKKDLLESRGISGWNEECDKIILSKIHKTTLLTEVSSKGADQSNTGKE